MVITSIKRSKKNKNKLLIYIDEEYAFSVLEEDYMKLNLYEKNEITKENIDYIKNFVNYSSAKQAALSYLSFKLRSGGEVRAMLEQKGYDNENIERVIDELTSLGYINDKIYAEKYIYDRIKLKPQSKKMLKHHLLAKGIDINLINEVMDGYELDEADVAEGLVRRKYGKYDLNEEKVQRKVYSFLLRRGFSMETANQAIRRVIQEDT